MEQVFFICLYIVLGLGSGFIGGLLGIGGGVVIVPALVISYDLSNRFAPEQSLLIAVATSLACIIFTSASAGYTQYRAGKVRWDLFQKLLAFLLLGSFLAGWIAPVLPPEVFRGFIGVFLAIVAVIMLSNWQPDAKDAFPVIWVQHPWAWAEELQRDWQALQVVTSLCPPWYFSTRRFTTPPPQRAR